MTDRRPLRLLAAALALVAAFAAASVSAGADVGPVLHAGDARRLGGSPGHAAARDAGAGLP